MKHKLHIATYNIHKGFSHFNWRLAIHDLRERLHSLNADLVFLQEVQGSNHRHAERYADWPRSPQYEYLADTIWTDFAYGKNSVYDGGHHGNAILSRFPIVRWDNENISAHRFENRGLLHCEIEIPGWDENLHCLNAHLGLFGRGRSKQLLALRDRIERLVPPHAPLVIAGDFNDWRKKASKDLAAFLHVKEVFEAIEGAPARSFPSALPLFRLDRIYVRGFHIEHARVYCGRAWSNISDHAALSATIVRS